jgi:hypothetical protein
MAPSNPRFLVMGENIKNRRRYLILGQNSISSPIFNILPHYEKLGVNAIKTTKIYRKIAKKYLVLTIIFQKSSINKNTTTKQTKNMQIYVKY